jgi:hypothetical protein
MRTQNLVYSGLITWLLAITVTSATAPGHWCNVPEPVVEYKDHKCKDIWTIIPTGFVFHKVLDNVKSDDIMSHPNAMCQLERTTHKIVTKCCTGWEGADCDKPKCHPPCINGGTCKGDIKNSKWTAPIPVCACPSPWGGVTCQENLLALSLNNKRYCYKSENCFGDLQYNDVKEIAECCTKGFSGSFGKQSNGIECTPCVQNDEILVNQTRDVATCMTSGEDIYRTFDNVYFHYHHPCAIGLLVSSWIDIYTYTKCDPVKKCACYKIVTILIQNNDYFTKYVLANTALTITTSNSQITRDASSLKPNKPSNLDESGSINWKIDDVGSIYIKSTTLDVSVRVDTDGTFMLTISKNSPLRQRKDISGICGNMNDNPDDELALKTPMGAERIFSQFTNPDLPCGTSLTGCAPDQLKKAVHACNPLKTAFYSCHRAVDVNDYMKRCNAAYCTSKTAAGEPEANKAVCNILSAYHKICTAVTGKAVLWRSASLCPKKCKDPFIFNGLMTNRCPPTCGWSKESYAKDSCKVTPFAGCECPAGKARINNTCVMPDKCQCRADNGRYYNRGEKIMSTDRCRICTCDTQVCGIVKMM